MLSLLIRMTKKDFIKFLIPLLLIPVYLSLSQSSPQEKINPHKASPDRILVKYKKQANPLIQPLEKVAIESTYGLQEVRQFSFIDVSLYKVFRNKEKILNELNKNPNIEYAEPDYMLFIHSIHPNDPAFPQQWGLHNTGQTGGVFDADMDALEAWDLTQGNSQVVVAVIDTGVDYNHEDLSTNIWKNSCEMPHNGIDDDRNGYIDDYYGINSADNNSEPADDNGHGTHCAGIIAAVGNNGIGVSGICWNAKIMGLKCFDFDGHGFSSGAIECIEYAIRKGAHIISSGWGNNEGVFIHSLKDAIEAARSAGILFIAAAGNEGINNDTYSHCDYPASFECGNIISVTSIDSLDNLKGNYGPYSVDVAAPGQKIFSTFPYNSYTQQSGTSTAVSHVAGLAALIKSYNPNLKWREIKNRILKGSVQTASLQGKILTGGRINAYNSLAFQEIGRAHV